MMKMIKASVVALGLFLAAASVTTSYAKAKKALPVDQAAPLTLGILAATQSQPRVLSFADGGLSSTGANTRTVSFTPPAGCNLAVFVVSIRHGNTSAFSSSPTFDGVSTTPASTLIQFDNRYTTGVYFIKNPTVGVAQDFVYSSTANWGSTWCGVYWVSAPSNCKWGNLTEYESGSSSTFSATMDPLDTGKPLIFGVVCAAYGSGGSNTDNTLTGLVNLQQDGGGTHTGNTLHASVSNRQVLSADPGSTTFTAARPTGWTANGVRMVVVELRSDNPVAGKPDSGFTDKTTLAASGTSLDVTLGCGTAHAKRVVVVAIQSRAATLSSVTIGGVAATLASSGSTTNARAAIYYAEVPTGTTVNITATLSVAQALAIQVYALYPTTPAPIDAQNTNSGGADNTLVTKQVEGGWVIGSGMQNNSSGDCTWTSGSLNTPVLLETEDVIAGGSFNASGAQIGPVTYTSATVGSLADFSVSANKAWCTASWPP